MGLTNLVYCVQGFRKVHPDRWEFAHESFLRGQTHLLPRIVRRKKQRGEDGGSSGGGASCSFGGLISGVAGEHHVAACTGSMLGGEEEAEDAEKEAALFEEVQRLRHEQTAIGEKLARMSQRLQATERRPDQLMSFLTKLADDPNAVSGHLLEQAAEKKCRRQHLPAASQHEPTVFPLSPAPPPPPPPPQPLLALAGAAAAMDSTWQWTEQKPIALPSFESPPTASCGVQQVLELGGGGVMGLTDGEPAVVDPPFPFCLLGKVFF
ncbi:hypothetical protein ABZP36_015382 [Zizania latifolia]